MWVQLTTDPLTVDLVNVYQVNADGIVDPADVCHVSACVFFFKNYLLILEIDFRLMYEDSM